MTQELDNMFTSSVVLGNRGDYELAAGPKVLLVASGGTLELHGRKKLSWTKLSKTIPKIHNSQELLYDHMVSKGESLCYHIHVPLPNLVRQTRASVFNFFNVAKPRKFNRKRLLAMNIFPLATFIDAFCETQQMQTLMYLL